jgi:hypothetical protein
MKVPTIVCSQASDLRTVIHRYTVLHVLSWCRIVYMDMHSKWVRDPGVCRIGTRGPWMHRCLAGSTHRSCQHDGDDVPMPAMPSRKSWDNSGKHIR